MTNTRALPPLLICVLLAGCPGDDGDSTSEALTTETGDGDPSGDGDGDPSGDGDGDPSGDGDGDPSGDGDPGECYDIFDDLTPPLGPDCNLPQPCNVAEFFSDGECEVSPTYDPNVGQCILDALAAGEAANVEIRDCPGGQFSESWFVQILGDGTAIWRRSESEDFTGNGRVTWRAMPDASVFEACDPATPQQLVACIEAITDEACQLGEPSCP